MLSMRGVTRAAGAEVVGVGMLMISLGEFGLRMGGGAAATAAGVVVVEVRVELKEQIVRGGNGLLTLAGLVPGRRPR